MRTLHLLASADRRGAEVFGTQLAEYLRSTGSEHEVVALHAATAGDGLAVDRVVPLGSVSGVRTLRARARAADAVLGHGSLGLIAGTAATLGTRTPFVYRSIGDPTYWGASRSRQVRVGVQLRRAAGVTALWPAAGAAIAEQYGVDPQRITIVPNAVDEARFAPADQPSRAAARAVLGIEAEHVALYVGALSSEKRLDAVLGAAAAVPGLHLILAGDGPDRSAVAIRAEELLPGRHHLLGSVPDVVPLYASADCLVLLSATEGQPGVAIEAGLCGLPVVATDVGGVSSVVVDGSTGRLVSADASAAEAATAISDAISDRDRLGSAANDRCRAAFTIASVGAQFDQLLRQVADRGA